MLFLLKRGSRSVPGQAGRATLACLPRGCAPPQNGGQHCTAAGQNPHQASRAAPDLWAAQLLGLDYGMQGGEQ